MLDSYIQYEAIADKNIESYIVCFTDMQVNPFCMVSIYKQNNYGYSCDFEATIKDNMIRIHDCEADDTMQDITSLLRFLLDNDRVFYIRNLQDVEADALISGKISLQEFETTDNIYQQ